MIRLKDLLNEGEIKMIGDDQDELLDAISFINKGIGKGSQTVKLPFGNDTLKALDKYGKRETATFVIRVKPTKSGAGYIKGVNEFLDAHGFDCRLVDTDDYRKAALEIVQLTKDIIKAEGESLAMGSEVTRATKVNDDESLSRLYYRLISILGNLIGDSKEFKVEARKIMIDKYDLFLTDEYGFNVRNKQR
jgi:hypothetical protein